MPVAGKGLAHNRWRVAAATGAMPHARNDDRDEAADSSAPLKLLPFAGSAPSLEPRGLEHARREPVNEAVIGGRADRTGMAYITIRDRAHRNSSFHRGMRASE